MAEQDMRERALATALRVAELCRCRQGCDNLADDLLRDATKILQWLEEGRAAELVFIVGPITEQT